LKNEAVTMGVETIMEERALFGSSRDPSKWRHLPWLKWLPLLSRNSSALATLTDTVPELSREIIPVPADHK